MFPGNMSGLNIAGSTNETKTEVTEMLACKVAPTISGSTNETKNAGGGGLNWAPGVTKMLGSCKVAPTTSNSPKKTKQVAPTTAADLAEEAKQVHGETSSATIRRRTRILLANTIERSYDCPCDLTAMSDADRAQHQFAGQNF